MKNRQNVTAIERIFDESEKVKTSEKELDQSLEDIGVNPDTLVASGLDKINALLNKSKEAEIIPIPSKYLIAASKKKGNINALKQDLTKKEEENKTSKKK